MSRAMLCSSWITITPSENMQQKARFRLTVEPPEALNKKFLLAGLYDRKVISLLGWLELPCNLLILSVVCRKMLQVPRNASPYRANGPSAYIGAYSLLEQILEIQLLHGSDVAVPSSQQLAFRRIQESLGEMEKAWHAHRGRPRDAGNHIFALHIMYQLKRYELHLDHARDGLFTAVIFWLKHAVGRWAVRDRPDLLVALDGSSEGAKISDPAGDAARKAAKQALGDNRGSEIMTPAFKALDSFGVPLDGSDLGKAIDKLVANLKVSSS